MSQHQKTISIGLETATGALEKFLASGDSPNHCIDVICTINRELQSSVPHYSSQDLVASFLDSKLLTSACDTLVTDGIPPLLGEVISEFFYLVTHSIFSDIGVINASLMYRNNKVLQRVCDFYQYFYKTALESKWPALLEHENRRINDLFVSAIRSNKVFITEFNELHESFAPLDFFVEHVSSCHGYVAECISLPGLTRSVSALKSVLRQKTAWGSAKVEDFDDSWKFQFYCEILKPTPISEFSLSLFHMFLESVESWKTLLFMSIRLLQIVPSNSSVSSIIAEAVNCRLALFGNILGQNLFDDEEESVVWYFIEETLKGGRFDLVMGLFYESCEMGAEVEPESTQNLRQAIFEFVDNSESFEQEFAKSLKEIQEKSRMEQECAIRLSNRRSLFGFFLSRIQNFHTNTTRVNRITRTVLLELCVFNCSHSAVHPGILYREFLGLIEAIHYERPKGSGKTMVSPLSPRNPSRENSSGSSIAFDSLKSFKVPEFLDMELVKDEGHRVNMKLFESCLAIVYAAIKARELRKMRSQ